ncbi:tetratricopeptide repeat protein [Sphingomonas changnyeongensis]|uniref:Tetratricopeptide repeat protein n=1 Tax=Sphingomonas changnyeongensis TaxID=2698679 RepID=A0A7Z2S5H5_9SPHN|nr:sulfotransferase [Sphingomonas changnyeongensis]QHL90373.1 tetratricopeptide repeat protein [Sphingomonas changnyeongensis]
MARAEEVHLNRAAIFSEQLADPASARAELERATALNPGFALAWRNLGQLHEDEGRAGEARAAYLRALELEPGNGHDLARIAGLDIVEGQAAAAADALARHLAVPGLAPADEAELLFALGAAQDALGAHAAAFAALARGNALVRQQIPPALRYDRRRHDALIDALIAMPPLPGLAQPAPHQSDPASPCPVFIFGLFRSGSTLAEQLLARHPAIASAGEMETIPAFVHQHLQPYPDRLAQADPALLARLRDDYLAELRQIGGGARFVCDKRCDNFLHLALLRTLFPEAVFIHTRRDRRDNMLSIFSLRFDDSIAYGWDLGDIRHWIDGHDRLMAHWHDRFGDTVLTLDYDALVQDPRAVMGDVIARMGLGWDEACLTTSGIDAPVRTASAWQVRRPLHSRSSGRWRDYAAMLAPAIDGLGDRP